MTEGWPCLGDLRQSKVEQLHTLPGHHNIGRLQIPVGDPFGVRGIQRIANLDGAFQCLIDRQGPLELRAFDVLHDQVIRTDIMEGTNVGMIQRRYSTSFVLEPFGELCPGNLDRDHAIEARIAGLINFTHSTRTDWCKYFIGSEFVAGRQRHFCVRAKFSRSESG